MNEVLRYLQRGGNRRLQVVIPLFLTLVGLERWNRKIYESPKKQMITLSL